MPNHQGPLGVDDLRHVVAIMAIGIPLTVRVFSLDMNRHIDIIQRVKRAGFFCGNKIHNILSRPGCGMKKQRFNFLPCLAAAAIRLISMLWEKAAKARALAALLTALPIVQWSWTSLDY